VDEEDGLQIWWVAENELRIRCNEQGMIIQPMACDVGQQLIFVRASVIN
jgi:hypothetical protein